MMFDTSKITHLTCFLNALSLACIELWYNFALAARLCILNFAVSVPFYYFFICNETIYSCAKFAAQTMALLPKRKKKKKW